MQINIKQLILEGYSYNEITEAVHANHPQLDKSRFKDKKLSYSDGKKIEQNRKALADKIKVYRGRRDEARKMNADGKGTTDNGRTKTQEANLHDNNARAISQTGGDGSISAVELKPFNFPKSSKIIQNVQRVISSAKK